MFRKQGFHWITRFSQQCETVSETFYIIKNLEAMTYVYASQLRDSSLFCCLVALNLSLLALHQEMSLLSNGLTSFTCRKNNIYKRFYKRF